MQPSRAKCFTLLLIAIIAAIAHGCSSSRKTAATITTEQVEQSDIQHITATGIGISQERNVAIIKANSNAQQQLTALIEQAITSTSKRYIADFKQDTTVSFERFVITTSSNAASKSQKINNIHLYDGKYTCNTELKVHKDTVLNCLNSIINGAFSYNQQEFERLLDEEIERLQKSAKTN